MRFPYVCAVLGCALFSASASAGFARFDEVPQAYASDPQRFAELFRSAETGTLRLGVLGDSQETSPGGAGRFYIPSLTHGFWRRYGNIPETQIAPNANEIEFLHRSASAGGVTTRVPASHLPPGIMAKAHSTLGVGGVTGSSYGSLFTLQHDALETHDASLRGYPYMDVSAGVRLEMFAATNNSSGEVAWRTKPRDSTGSSYFEPIVQSGVSAMGLESPSPGVKSFITPTLSFDGKTYLQGELFGTDPTKLTDVIGARFLSNNPTGVALQDFSAGGYRVSSLLANHGQAGNAFAAVNCDAYVLHYGANDASGVSATQFKINTETLIAQLRVWHDDPELRIILAGDPDRAGLSAVQRAEFDQFAGAHYAIAQSDPNVLLLNTRLLAHEAGWYAGGAIFDQFVYDGVHYTEDGARLLARLEVDAVFASIPEPSASLALLLLGIRALHRTRR